MKEIRTKEEEELRKIAEIVVRGPSRTAYKNEYDGILRSIFDSFVERTMTERLIASVNVRNVNRVSVVRDPKPLEAGHYNCIISEVASKTRHSRHTPEEVSRKFDIGIERVKETIKVTTQKGIHHAVHPLHHRYHVDHMQLIRNGSMFSSTVTIWNPRRNR